MKAFVKSLYNAGNGLRTTWREEQNFRIEIFTGVIVVAVMILLDFSFSEFIPMTLAIILVLMAEIMNTAIEDLTDFVQPKYDPMIGKIKDLSAAFVLVASIGAVIVGVIVFSVHFFGVT